MVFVDRRRADEEFDEIKSPRGKANVHVTYVSSDNEPLLGYEIKRHPKGHLLCGCESFAFCRKPKTCKHLKAWSLVDVTARLLHVSAVKDAKQPLPTPTHVTINAETFRFRRAITFGDV